jgi:hypothetical protein
MDCNFAILKTRSRELEQGLGVIYCKLARIKKHSVRDFIYPCYVGVMPNTLT